MQIDKYLTFAFLLSDSSLSLRINSPPHVPHSADSELLRRARCSHASQMKEQAFLVIQRIKRNRALEFHLSFLSLI